MKPVKKKGSNKMPTTENEIAATDSGSIQTPSHAREKRFWLTSGSIPGLPDMSWLGNDKMSVDVVMPRYYRGETREKTNKVEGACEEY